MTPAKTTCPARTAPCVRKDFPLRVAGIDIGSNAIRFIAAEFLNPTRSIVLESERPLCAWGPEPLRTAGSPRLK